MPCVTRRRSLAMDVRAWLYTVGTVFHRGPVAARKPGWLVKAGNIAGAKAILTKIGDGDFASGSLSDIRKSLAGNARTNYRAVFSRAVLPAVIVGIGIAVFQQLCGINTVFNYAPKIFASIGASQDDQLLQTVFIGGVNLTFTLLAMTLVTA